jgi:hypothetical protein
MIENSMCHDITTEEFDKELNEYTLSVNLPKPKSKIMIGSNTVIFNDRHFNWLQKKMWKILLGIKIEDIKE